MGWLKKRKVNGAVPDREKRELRQEQLDIAARLRMIEQRRDVMTRREKNA